MADEHFSFSKINDNIYLGADYCGEHESCQSQWQLLQTEGIEADINLEVESVERPAPEVKIYLWLPTQDKAAPTQEQLAVGVALIDRLIKDNKKVYVHCALGHGRSPTLVAAYLVSQGMSVDEAVEVIKQRRPGIHLEDVQVRALHDFAGKGAY